MFIVLLFDYVYIKSGNKTSRDFSLFTYLYLFDYAFSKRIRASIKI